MTCATTPILSGLRHRALTKGEDGHVRLQELECFRTITDAFGTKGMLLENISVLSSLCIVPEAGLNRQSKAGNNESVRANILHNYAKNAYQQHSYKVLAEKLPRPVGIGVSYLEETTKETFIDAMGGQVDTGETARALSFQIDVSRCGESQLLEDDMPPPHILDYFDALVTEAIRGEDPTLEFGQKSRTFPAAGTAEVPRDMRRIFKADPETREYIDQLLKERTAIRRANKENIADLAWAQRGRYEQLLLRLALVHCRTRRICGPDRYSPAASVVEMCDVLAAQAVVDESRRTERANAGDFDTATSRLGDIAESW